MIWDQTYGDFGTYEEAQITTAAKGADAMNPGLTMNLVVKSGSNTFKGLGANYQSGDFQSDNITHELLRKAARGTNKFTKLQDYYGEVGGPILKDACGSTPAIATRRPATSFPASSGCRIASRWSSTPSCRIRPARSLSDHQEQQVRGHVPGRPQVAAVSHREPLRAARVDAEPGLVVADRPVVQVAVGAVAEVDVRSEPAARRLLVARRAVDDGRPRPTWRPTTVRRAARSSRPIARRGAGSTAPTPTSPSSAAAITS